MAATQSALVTIDTAAANRIRHPIKAATLLYSAPGTILRGPIYMTFVTLFALFIYSFYATSDVLVTAPLSLQRQVISVQAVGGGLVDAIHVKENALVSAGTPIATVQEKIRAAATPEQAAILKQKEDLLQQKDTQQKDYDHRLRQVELERQDLEKRQSTGVGELRNRIGQTNLQLKTAENNKAGLEKDVVIARQDLASREKLFANRDIPRTEVERAQQRVRDLERSIANAENEIGKIKLSLQSAESELQQLTDQNAMERLLKDIEKLKADQARDRDLLDKRVADLEQRLQEAGALVPGVHYEGDKAYYSSVHDGIVSAIHVQPGQIINPGAPVATLVPSTAPLEARVLVQNKDIGKLKHRQLVQIKYFAYPYQEYGIQTGEIADISTRPSTVASENSLYVVTVVLRRETIASRNRPDRPKSLEIGLQGVAEIKTGEKRFIELLFAPASRFFRGGADE